MQMIWTEHFTKDNKLMTNKHMKSCSLSSVIREVQIKPQWDTTAHLLEWLKKNKQNLTLWNNGNMPEQWYSHSLLIRIQNVQPLSKT